MSASTVLVLTVTLTERNALMTAVNEVNRVIPWYENHGEHTVFHLGQVNRTEILLAQSTEQGGIGPGAMLLTTADLISSCRPDYLILTGICYGLREDRQRLGDVLVARTVQELDHRRVIDIDGELVSLRRGARVHSSVILMDRFNTATLGWDGPAVHFGLMLSANTLVDSAVYRRQCREFYPDAIGGEMEGAAVYAASAKGKVDWIVVKGISDWGMGKTDDHQETAARSAARFVVHMIHRSKLPSRQANGASAPESAS